MYRFSKRLLRNFATQTPYRHFALDLTPAPSPLPLNKSYKYVTDGDVCLTLFFVVVIFVLRSSREVTSRIISVLSRLLPIF